MRTRITSLFAAVSLGLVAAVTLLPGTALMATQTRLYFAGPDYSCSYDYDDVALKLTAVHCTNNSGMDFGVQICRSSDDAVLRSFTVTPGQHDFILTGAQQAAITLNSAGKISNIYAKTF